MSEATARAHQRNLNDLQTILAIDLETDWTKTRLRHAREMLDRSDRPNDRTKAEYRRSLDAYDTFRSHTSA